MCLVVRKLPISPSVFKMDVVSASHGASSKHDAEMRCFLPEQSPTSKQSFLWMKKHNLWPDLRPTMRDLGAVPGEDI